MVGLVNAGTAWQFGFRPETCIDFSVTASRQNLDFPQVVISRGGHEDGGCHFTGGCTVFPLWEPHAVGDDIIATKLRRQANTQLLPPDNTKTPFFLTSINLLFVVSTSPFLTPMVRFVESDEIGVPPKRKQVSNACGSCRKRKKRCTHHNFPPSTASVDRSSTTSPLREESPRRPQPPSLHATTPPIPANTQSTQQVSLPPATSPGPVPGARAGGGAGAGAGAGAGLGAGAASSVPTAGSVPSTSTAETPNTEENDTLKARFVGDTNVEGLLVEAVSPRSKRDSLRGGVGIWISPSAADSPSAMTLAHRGLESVILPYVRDICLKVVPPHREFIELRRIYLEKIHPLFPVLDDVCLNHHPDDTLPGLVLVRQAISLAAGTDNDAGPHLRFEVDKPALTHAEFSTTLTSAIRATIDSGIITDRLILSRCLSLLSLYIQPPTSEDTDLPAMIGCRAIHYGQTMAVQIKGKSDEEEREMERLFLCMWTLDRLNGAFYGRPCLMHDRDFSRSLDDAIAGQDPAFRLFLAVIKFLDQVTTLYRPGAPTCDFFDLSAMEELIIKCGAARLASTTLATIEVFYNAVIILSCRLPSPGRDGRGAVPIPAASCRRSLAAERITFVVAKEFKGRLSPLPIVPYSVSLALSVAYRKMRYTKVPMYYTRSKGLFATNCGLLRSLGDLFWSAKVLAALGDRVLKEMEKAMSSIADQAQGPGQGHGGGGGGEGGGGEGGGGGEWSSGAGRDRASEFADSGGIQAGVGDTGSGGSGAHGQLSGGGAGVSNASGLMTANPETTFFDSLPDMDLFGHLDPGFNIDAVDAALEANLDLGLQVNWPDWHDWGGS
ncbi:hypothetical protein MKZ38_009998 [Zalerion maritima]|uniref:Transcription factor domain-containing protein n=1 Tax=Zalerion maritima TaxID=339359 RepID=A0AAD5RFP0_9PEZI|nr:hypothetical protein MKZ38_009998 [Zalerion maritima]